jgi:dihydroxyacetone kinase-like protein
MGKAELTAEETKKMFLWVCLKMVESKDLLTAADKAIGDGDHGIGMARGFESVGKKLETGSFESIGDILKSVGMSLVTSVGGAAGAVFGTLFMGGGKNLGDTAVFNSRALSMMLEDGLDAVKRRGNAKPGDKTMIDSLQPAASKSATLAAAPLDEALEAACRAAKEGMEHTKEMVAKTGKAKPLGERSLGHPDPGAISVFLILDFMREYISEAGRT